MRSATIARPEAGERTVSNGQQRSKPTKLIFTAAPSTLSRLKASASRHGVRIAEVVRWALTIFAHIEDAKLENPRARVLLDRGDGKPLELLLPF